MRKDIIKYTPSAGGQEQSNLGKRLGENMHPFPDFLTWAPFHGVLLGWADSSGSPMLTAAPGTELGGQVMPESIKDRQLFT